MDFDAFARVLVATTCLEPKHVTELCDVFAYFDVGQVGALDAHRARLAWRAAGVVWNEQDLISLGSIGQREFLKKSAQYLGRVEATQIPADKWRSVFSVLDIMQKGEIKPDGLRTFLRSTGVDATLEEVQYFIDACSKYGMADAVTEDDFVKYMEKIEKKQKAASAEPEMQDGANSDSTVDVASAFDWH